MSTARVHQSRGVARVREHDARAPAAASRERRRRPTATPGRREPSEGRARPDRVLQLAALHRPQGHQGLREAVRRRPALRRGHQRQQRVLRQGPPAARAGRADGPRPRRADGLDGRALDPPRLPRADRQAQHAERAEEPDRGPAQPGLRQGPHVHGAVAVRHHRHRLQPQGRRRAHVDGADLRPAVQGQGHVPRGRARHDEPRDADGRRQARGGDARRRDGGDRQGRRGQRGGADRAASPATTTRPI